MPAQIQYVDSTLGLDISGPISAGDTVSLVFSVTNAGDEPSDGAQRCLVTWQDADNAPAGHQYVALGHIAAGDQQDVVAPLTTPASAGEYTLYVYVDHDGHSAHGGHAMQQVVIGE